MSAATAVTVSVAITKQAIRVFFSINFPPVTGLSSSLTRRSPESQFILRYLTVLPQLLFPARQSAGSRPFACCVYTVTALARAGMLLVYPLWRERAWTCLPRWAVELSGTMGV